MQGYQVCLVGSAAFAIAVDPLKLPRLPHLIDEVLIQRHFKRRGQLHLVAFHFEYLNGRGFEFFWFAAPAPVSPPSWLSRRRRTMPGPRLHKVCASWFSLLFPVRLLPLFLHRNAGVRALCHHLLFDQRRLALRKNENDAVQSAFGVAILQREDVDSLSEQTQEAIALVRRNHRQHAKLAAYEALVF